MPDKKISIDEVMNIRKEFSNDDGILFKAHTKVAGYQEATRSARFVMSAEVEDRMHDIVVQSGIDRSAFDSNPIAFFNHKSGVPPIGQWHNVKTIGGNNKRTEGDLVFVEEGIDPAADVVRNHVKAGTIRAASIGFRPKPGSAEKILDGEGNWVNYGIKFNEIELHECSAVCVPAVREALMKMAAGEDVEVASLEVFEKFLQDLTENPSLASQIDRKHYEDVLRAAGGEKTTIIFPEKEKSTVDLSVDVSEMKSIVEQFGALVERAEKVSKGIEEIQEEIEDEVITGAKSVISTAHDDLTKTLDDVDESDEEKRGIIQGMIDGLKGLFTSEPELATSEEKEAAKNRLKAIQDKKLSKRVDDLKNRGAVSS